MSELTIEQQRFQEAPSWPGPSLSAFYNTSSPELFPNCAGGWPDFFNQNLVSPYRVLKILINSPHANIRVFYFQLLRVSYEVETDQGFNRSFIYNLIQIVFSQGFEVFFSADTDSERELFNDQTFKKLFAQFINLLETDAMPQVERFLNSYPIMDTVLVHIFRSILASQDINFPFGAKIPTETVIGELSGLLGLAVQAFGNNCWKFDDSDMFCYEYSDNELYLAYILDAGMTTSEEASQEPVAVQPGPLTTNYDMSTTQTIQLDSTGYRPELSSGPIREPTYNLPPAVSSVGIEVIVGGRSQPTYESVNNSVMQRVQDITYKPAASIGLVVGYENPLSYSVAQSSFQTSSYSQDILNKSSAAGALGASSFDQINRGSSAFGFDSFSKPTPAYVAPSYKPAYEPLNAAADIGRYTLQSSNYSAGIVSGGEYYNDFTNDRLLDKLEEPFRSRVAQIKSRVRDWRRVQVPTAGASSYSSSFKAEWSWNNQ